MYALLYRRHGQLLPLVGQLASNTFHSLLLSQDKWDTSDHDFDNSLRDQDGEPWHDVNAMIKGPIIWDLIFHFNQRWIYSLTKDIKQVKKAKINSSGSFLSSSLSLNQRALAPFTNRDNEGNIEISALRTWKQLKGNIEDKDDNEDDGDSSSSRQCTSMV